MKFGKMPYRADPRTLKLADYLNANQLPVPPASLDLSADVPDWPMYGNDVYGDCTCAAAGHMIELWTAMVASEKVPSRQAVVNMYLKITSGQDVGAQELDVLKYWRHVGLAHNKVFAFAAVGVTDHTNIMRSVSMFGGCYVGFIVPPNLIEDFNAGKTWDVQPGTPKTNDGHAVNIVGYDSQTLTVITWGRTQKMTWRFWDAYGDESWAILTEAWKKAPPPVVGLDFKSLENDLVAVGKIPPP